MHIIVIGAGIVGMSCAYYLNKAGYTVTVLDKSDSKDNCSFGNAGYVSPSHFIPLATPGIVLQGLRWMTNNASPFYIKPRLDKELIKWGLKFIKSANKTTVEKNAPHLYSLLSLSRQLMIDIDYAYNHGFSLEKKGCFMLYRTKKIGEKEKQLAKEATLFNIETHILSPSDIQEKEPYTQVNAMGGVYFPIDCHVHPIHMMQSFYKHLPVSGVTIHFNQEVKNCIYENNKIKAVQTNDQVYEGDAIVMTGGAWLPQLAALAGEDILIQAGKGYSMTYEGINRLVHPSILVDDRVAITPLGRDLRIGGTMEMSGINHTIHHNRVNAIVSASKRFYPDLNIETPSREKIWHGLRPVSPDGLPYIGQSAQYKNVYIAGGHAMIGVSMGAGTGLLIEELISNKKPSLDLTPYRLNRFK